MPLPLSYPGVYVEEVESTVRTIVGVATSITAFVGVADDGPANDPKRVLSLAEYEATFGRVTPGNELSQSVQLFFLNGGTDAYVVNARKGGAKAAGTVKTDPAGGIDQDALTVTARTAGRRGNQLRLRIDYDTSEPANTFNLTVLRRAPGDRPLDELEATHRNLSMNPDSPRFVETYLAKASRYVEAKVAAPAGALAAEKGVATSGDIPAGDLAELDDAAAAPGAGKSLLAVSLDGGPPADIDILTAAATFVDKDANGRRTLKGAAPAAKFASLAGAIQSLLQNTSPAATCTATAAAPWKLTITSGVPGVKSAVRVVAAADPARAATAVLRLGPGDGGTGHDAAARIRPAASTLPTGYLLGENGAGETRQGGVTLGADGVEPGADEAAWKGALDALRPVDLFNLLVVPGFATLGTDAVKRLTGVVHELCEFKRAFYIADLPPPPDPKDMPGVVAHYQQFLPRIKTRGAVYFPRVVGVPLSATGGAIAGVYARTDAQRGVWKAPAGTEAVLRGVTGLETKLDDRSNGVLNLKGINALRTFPTFGDVVWGARTADGDDNQASQWKYTPVRRTALFIEESLYRGTQWIVFEPNDEPLWAQIRLNVGSFMQNLFRQGAFQGKSATEAYFVRCDKSTTTQDDINRGVVNILVGFAPLKPAEYVVIRLQQMAGQIGV